MGIIRVFHGDNTEVGFVLPPDDQLWNVLAECQFCNALEIIRFDDETTTTDIYNAWKALNHKCPPLSPGL